MKQFLISLFLLLPRYYLAQHIACTKERPFPTKYNDCGSFKDICNQYRSDDCKSALRACEQCPWSNFTSESLYQVLRIIYGGQDKSCSQTKSGTRPIQESPNENCSQIRIETNPVQKCPSNAVLWIILIIVSFLLAFSILILIYFIYQCIKGRKRRNHERSYFNLLTLGNQNDLDSVNRKLKKNKESQKYFISRKLEEIASELSILPNKIKSEKPTEICISWEDAENGLVPSGAIKVGNSCFIARAVHKREYIPGILVPNDKCVYVGYAGHGNSISQYQVLVETSILNQTALEWKYARRQDIPVGAIIGGTDNGRALYIAKDVIEGEDVVGKFQPEHECAYFPSKDKEFYTREPVLVLCYS